MEPRLESSATLLRALCFLVLALMAAAIVYTGWIAITDYERIGV